MSETPVPEPVWAEVLEVTQSPTIGLLIAALAKSQLKFKPVFKQSENEAFKRGGRASKYADLAAYIEATQTALAENELVVMQWPDVSPEAKSMSLVSILAHSSGEWVRGKLTLPAIGRDGFTAQSCGSSITYARRYSYAAITGCASEDDDGNAASGRGSAEAAKEVADEKIAKLRKKVAPDAPDVVPGLFYAWFDESQTAQITGDEGLMTANRDLLKRHWNANVKAIVVNAEELENLKYAFEQREVLFKQLKAGK